jgi:hypothetical protein
MRKTTAWLGIAIGMLTACEKNKVQGNNFFDSLIQSNHQYLLGEQMKLATYSQVGQSNDSLKFTPDSLAWANELEVFRQLDVFQKPAFNDAYVVTRGVKDDRSNLLTTEYRANRVVPVAYVKFYYMERPENLKKIEAVYEESNTLYVTRRHLALSFHDVDGRAVISGYSLSGLQRMILSDSVIYKIEANVIR